MVGCDTDLVAADGLVTGAAEYLDDRCIGVGALLLVKTQKRCLQWHKRPYLLLNPTPLHFKRLA